MPNFKQLNKQFTLYVKYSAFVMQMIVIIIAAALGGYYLDLWLFNKISIFTVILSLSAIVFTIYRIIQELSGKHEKHEKSSQS